MTGLLSICTRQETFGFFDYFALSATPLCLVRYIFLEKGDFSWNISSWCMPQLERFLLIWQVFYPYVQGKRHSVSLTIFLYLRLSYALYGTFFRKRWFFMKYFKLVHAPTWKIPYYMQVFYSYVQGKKHFGILYNFPLPATLLCLVRSIFLEKMIFYEIFQVGALKYFKLVHAPTWKIPYYMTGFLSICTRHEAFGIFNIFPLSATPSCPVRYFLFLEKDEFLINYFKLVHAPTWKIP